MTSDLLFDPARLETSGGQGRRTATPTGSDYAVLSRVVRAAGLLDHRPIAYAARVALTLGFYLAACAAVVLIGDSWNQAIAAVVLGVAFTQVAFLGHDGGHQQIFRNRRANDLFGQLTGNLLVGLSFGWWVGKHNKHHANPNKEDHDPDIGDGVLAFTTSQVAARTGRFGRASDPSAGMAVLPAADVGGLEPARRERGGAAARSAAQPPRRQQARPRRSCCACTRRCTSRACSW